MAQGKILVETEQLDEIAKQVGEKAAEYKTEYTSLFQTVAGLKEVWEGKDNIAFTEQIDGFRNDFERMYTLMTEYQGYLNKVASAYRTTSELIAAKAKQLSQGE